MYQSTFELGYSGLAGTQGVASKTDSRSVPGLSLTAARQAFPDVHAWMPLLRRLGISLETAMAVHHRALRDGTSVLAEIVTLQVATEQRLYRTLAEAVGVPFVETVAPDRLILSEDQCIDLLRQPGRPLPVKIEEPGGRTAYLLVPQTGDVEGLRRMIARSPVLAGRIRITMPSALRAGLMARSARSLSHIARNDLFERYPHLSAKAIPTGWQGLVLGVAIAASGIASIFWLGEIILASHLALTLFFLGCVTLRVAAATVAAPGTPSSATRMPDEAVWAELPIYTVLVALHREAEMAPQLLRALDALVWPAGKLEIKLLCEADDRETIEALRAASPAPNVEIVEVPPSQPRTKPKALNFVLPVVRGDYLVLYDAEDRPHPFQLLEAWRRFEASPKTLVCVQAPLEIANGAHARTARLFAFEYAGLFRGLLPWLSGREMLLPLGGTSNHFRVEALRAIGGWDPYNVTEDADLGFRLARAGCTTGTITLPTLEDAPEDLRVWLPQRTRWFKGWIQTWLVHMRDPVALYRELGFRSFCVAQLVCTGLVFSALLHPLLVAVGITLAMTLIAGVIVNVWQVPLLLLDIANIVFGYAGFLVLGWRAEGSRNRLEMLRIAAWTPLYWLMLSRAAWRALWHLWRRPHHWEKTPHALARGPLLPQTG